ncbi:STY1053 family phage-associated protein [Cupriavidus pauculus]|jgi:hypothetical protein
MPKIYVKKAFTLHHKDEKHEFPVGNHTVPADVAEHWYTKAHTGEEPAPSAEGDADLAEKRAALDSAAEFLEGRAKELKELQDALDVRAGTLTDREQAVEQREAGLNARAEALDEREAALAQREQALATAEKAAADAAAKTGKK